MSRDAEKKRPHIATLSLTNEDNGNVDNEHILSSLSSCTTTPTTQNSQFKLWSLSSKKTDISRTNDDIHASISLCPVTSIILNTPQLQRLRGLKQLGLAEYTYINVTHTRFEHSLGVAHLAEHLCLRLQKKQPQLGITKKDVLCVKIAGLCHDLGHGPFSHVYDGDYFRSHVKTLATEEEEEEEEEDRDSEHIVKRRRLNSKTGKKKEKDIIHHDFRSTLPKKWRAAPKGWKHEHASLLMVDALLAHLGMKIDERNLDKPLLQIGDGIDAASFGILDETTSSSAEDNNHNDDDDAVNDNNIFTSRDWIFIKELILGNPLSNSTHFVGRPTQEKEFLYDIVANRHSGLDVDKIDYYARDTRRALGSAGNIEIMFVEEAFVAWGKCPNPKKCFKCRHLFSPDDENDNDDDDDDTQQQKSPSKQTKKNNNTKENKKEGMHLMLSYPAKMVTKAMEFFKTRFSLHESVYTHKTTKAAELMMCDILIKADPFIKIPTQTLPAAAQKTAATITTTTAKSNGSSNDHESDNVPPYLPISCAMLHPSSYVKLKDSVIDLIEQSEDPGILPAQELLGRLRSRDMYKCVASQPIRSLDGIEMYAEDKVLWERCNSIRRDIVEMSGRHKNKQNQSGEEKEEEEDTVKLEENDILVEKRQIHHGMKEHNPVNRIRFLPKREMQYLGNDIPNLPEARQANEEDYLSHIPRAFLQRTIRLYCRGSTEKAELLRHCFEQWVEDTRNEAKTFFAEDGNDVVCCDMAGVEMEEDVDKKPPALCSQDTDVMTPARNHHGGGGGISSPSRDFSPHPVAAASASATHKRSRARQRNGPSKAIRNILSNLDD